VFGRCGRCGRCLEQVGTAGGTSTCLQFVVYSSILVRLFLAVASVSLTSAYLPQVTPTLNHRCLTPTVNPLTPNDPYSGRTAPLTSKRCILYIYSTNIGTEYFNMVYTLRFFLFKMQFVSKF